MSSQRRYRLTDAAMQPHPCLDVDFPSLQEALDSYQASIGVEVSTERGDWRTLITGPDQQGVNSQTLEQPLQAHQLVAVDL